ncbi:uncharacterized protein LOC113334841 [Papaver somniferum]|uniref:uncharacterized protein LOC113334841 n=1 Tax=Papaver somniferum TaxID=3469 RepID=UPI000E6FB2BF|nr:uncharacterized protein LOC113334841 [Papaver somniferum]
MRPSGIQIRESEAVPHEHEDAESYEESVVLHRRVGSTSDAQNTEMPSINVREDDGVSDTYEIDEVDYDTDELHDSNTFMNQVAVVATDVRHFLGQMDVKCQHCGALHWMAENTNSF